MSAVKPKALRKALKQLALIHSCARFECAPTRDYVKTRA